MHTFSLCEPNEVDERLAEIDEKGDTIISCFYITETQQIGIITKGKGDMYSAMKRMFDKDAT